MRHFGPLWTELGKRRCRRVSTSRSPRKSGNDDDEVGEVLDAERFKSIVNRIGDVKELGKLFA